MIFMEKPEYRERVVELSKGAESMAEIGVWMGYMSWMVLDQVETLRDYMMVDPWSMTYAENAIKEDALGGRGQEGLNTLFRKISTRCQARHPNARIYRMTSEDASHHAEDNYFDHVHIDANHAYDYVKVDIEKWLPKVKSGGLLTGDDYNQAGVRQAVDELLPGAKIEKNRLWIYETP